MLAEPFLVNSAPGRDLFEVGVQTSQDVGTVITAALRGNGPEFAVGSKERISAGARRQKIRNDTNVGVSILILPSFRKPWDEMHRRIRPPIEESPPPTGSATNRPCQHDSTDAVAVEPFLDRLSLQRTQSQKR